MKKTILKRRKNGKTQLLRKFLRGSKMMFFAGMIFTAITALSDMIIPQIVRFTVDNIIGNNSFTLPEFLKNWLESIGGKTYILKNLWIMAIAVMTVAVIKTFSEYFFRICNFKATETFSKTARDSLFVHISKLPCSWHKANKTGDIIQRCTSDIGIIKDFLSWEMTSLVRIIILITLSLLFMFSMNVYLTLIALAVFPIVMLNSVIFDKYIERTYQKCEETDGKLSASVQENLTGVRVVRAFGKEKSETEKFKKQNIEYTTRAKKFAVVMGSFNGIADILSGIQIMLVVVLGAVFCVKGSMTSGEYIAFVTYNTMLSWPLNELGRIITEMSKSKVSFGRICYIMESEVEEPSGKALKPDLNGDIVFENVSFSYNDNVPVLKNISFQMKAGTTLGILGGTGSGKSTIVALLDKLYPLEEGNGKISVGGVDIRDIDTQYLRENIGTVLQDPFLFSGTLSYNIGITNENNSDCDIEKAAKASCLLDTVSRFTKKYDTYVGERGITLSGGQKQRVAIARILIGNKPILIFDDSLSAVDTETDAKIRASLEAKFGTASIIIISHRISTLAKADKILVLENGEAEEFGTPEELVLNNGIYKKIFDIQMGREEDL